MFARVRSLNSQFNKSAPDKIVVSLNESATQPDLEFREFEEQEIEPEMELVGEGKIEHYNENEARHDDFSLNDEKLIAHAINQGHKSATYILLHIVESVSAKFLGEESDDDETRKDKQRLENFAEQLQALGYKVETHIGYRNRIKEIVRIVRQSEAEMLVMGAHRHSGIKDYLFGETIEAVRHELPIPVLIVNM